MCGGDWVAAPTWLWYSPAIRSMRSSGTLGVTPSRCSPSTSMKARAFAPRGTPFDCSQGTPVDEDRYARHIPLFGAEGQERIGAASVAMVGLGGLGSQVAQQLAYLGVSRFHLMDGDVVSTSNLNRLI